MINNIIRRIFKKLGYHIEKKNIFNKNQHSKSFSQCGEDILIDYVFKLRGLYMPTYIDIGANHPYRLNNTAIFYERGCSGINIDANPLLIEKFLNERPRDTNLNIGIGSVEGDMTFYIMEDDTLSTFSEVEKNLMVSMGKKFLTSKKVNVKHINGIMKQNFQKAPPDLMTIDVEGLDYEIISSLDFNRHAPKVICIEAAEYSPIGAGARRIELINFLVSKGYFEYANTNLNAIMIRNDFWFI